MLGGGSFRQSVAIARRKGHAVVIAHPHRITLDFLEAQFRDLPDDVRLTSLGALIAPRARTIDRTLLALPGSPGFPSRSLGQ